MRKKTKYGKSPILDANRNPLIVCEKLDKASVSTPDMIDVITRQQLASFISQMRGTIFASMIHAHLQVMATAFGTEGYYYPL